MEKSALGLNHIAPIDHRMTDRSATVNLRIWEPHGDLRQLFHHNQREAGAWPSTAQRWPHAPAIRDRAHDALPSTAIRPRGGLVVPVFLDLEI